MIVGCLARLVDPSLAESIVGDLQEQRRRRAAHSRVSAALWFYRESLGVAIYALGQRVVAGIRAMVTRPSRSGGFGADIKYTARSLRRSPWYAATVIGVIALGMALATTVFAVVDGVLFKPLPYPDSSALVIASHQNALSLRDLDEWAEDVSDARFSAFQQPFEIGPMGEGHPVIIRGACVDERFFDVLGMRPAIGGFTPEHFAPSSSRMPAVISYQLWQSRFGGRTDVVGLRLDIAGAVNQIRAPLPALEVVGVLPRDFVYPTARYTPDVLLPFALSPEQQGSRNWTLASALVRLPASLSPDVLVTRLNAIAARQDFPTPATAARPTLFVTPVGTVLVRWQRDNLRIAFAIAIALLLLTSVNVAGLGLARGRERAAEWAMRQALGASGARLLRLGLAEIAVPAAVGTVIAMSVAPALLRATVAAMPADVVLLETPRVDWRVGVFGVVANVLVMTICLLVRSRQFRSRGIGAIAGRGSTTTPRRGRVAMAMIAVQIGLTFVLTIGGALVVSSLWRIWQEDPGFATDHTVFVELSFGPGPAARRLADTRALADSYRGLPGVDQVALMGAPFLENSVHPPPIRLPAGTREGREELVTVEGDFFPLMGIRAIEGRLPTRTELDSGAPVAVVSERVARVYWPGRQALGQVMETGRGSEAFTVIGVVADVRFGSLGAATGGQVYWPGIAWSRPIIFVHGTAPPSDLLRAVTDQVRASNPSIGVVRAMTIKDGLGASVSVRAFRAWLFGSFALAALVIAGFGILGLTAMTTARRTRELGIRFSLGATRDDVVRMLVREQSAGVLAGLIAGGGVSWWAVQFVKAYLFGLTMHDGRVWTVAVLVMAAVGVGGAVIPALRASRVDPVRALKVE